MNEAHVERIAQAMGVSQRQVAAVSLLIEGGATVPFIARYRKEMTGSLDEVAITGIRDRLDQLRELDARRESIVKSLQERNLLTPALEKAVVSAATLSALEDIYQPYRPKKRTRATIAKEQGLEALADWIWSQKEEDPQSEAARYVSAEKGVESAEKALAGARDILAERISDDQAARGKMRLLYSNQGVLYSKVLSGKEEEGAKYRDYFDWNEPIGKAPSHRVLAMRRGEKEMILSLRIAPLEAEAISQLESLYVKGCGKTAEQVRSAVQDSYKRLLGVSMETEIRLESKKKADVEAIRVFAENLRELLLASPLGQRRVLAIDPGFRTGCKVVALDAQGKLLHHDVVYPDQSAQAREGAGQKIKAFCEYFKIEAIAVGNGTAGRETEAFLRTLGLPPSISVVMVNESGASIYSASEVAREEFPDQDITVRGSVSIGRRLMDPLAELVKLDPKSIGVGQYQHDVDQNALKKSLDDVVISCVNAVGVEVNTASKQLLSYVSGLGSQLAENIVAHRNANGPFQSREDLRKVARLGPKAFEQAAGFLRIRGAQNPLDESAVHPERYELVDRMAREAGCSVKDLMESEALRKKIDLKKYVTEQAGLPTLNDIMQELAKPGRDPRQKFEVFQFADGIAKIEDLKPGMKIPGIITNVTAFGAFVDVGVHQDGLVHVSQIADHFVSNPAEVVKVQQRVTVTVMEVDLQRRRIGLSMKSKPEISSVRSVPAGDGGRKVRQENRRPEALRNVQGDWFSVAMDKAKRN